MGAHVPAGLELLLRERFPRHRIVAIRPLGADATATGATAKGAGYGVPLRIELAGEGTGTRRDLVLHFAAANVFGHDRRADRAEEMLLAYDTFARIPRHARALDVGALGKDGALISLRDTGEFWLLTDWAPGHVYADDLRRVAAAGRATPADLARAEALARCLVELHARREDDPPAYTRAIRDLVGHGEGVFGIVDGYPPDVPGAPPSRLEAIERACVAWRWRVKPRAHRLRRTHGDFHPFNVIFDGDTLTLLDASRGGHGDPADDVTCMAINFPFFALETDAWRSGLGPLWRRYWEIYLGTTGDTELAEVAAPFFAWRGLVLANPRWYPALSREARDRLLGFVEHVLAAPRFDPAMADAIFA